MLRLVDISEYKDMQPGEIRVRPDEPTYCIYRKTGEKASLLPLEKQFVLTTCRRAESMQRLARLNTEQRSVPSTLTAPEDLMRNRTRAFRNPIDELLAELAPGQCNTDDFLNVATPTAVQRPQYLGATGAFGAHSSIPVTRRNPRAAAAPSSAQGLTIRDINLNTPNLRWRDFVAHYGRDMMQHASQMWARYKAMHGITTSPEAAERIARLKANKAAKDASRKVGAKAKRNPDFEPEWAETRPFSYAQGSRGAEGAIATSLRNPRGRR